MATEKERFFNGLTAPDTSNRDIQGIIVAALALERRLYAQKSTTGALFTLRKALEGIWGNELPELDEHGEELKDGSE